MIIGCVALLQIDDDLDSDVKKYVLLIEDRALKGSEAYLYITGIAAAPNDENLSPGVANKSEAEKLPIPDQENQLHCKLHKADCLSKIINASNEWEAEIQKFSILAERYEKFISYPEYTTMSKPDLAELYPEYKYLSYGNRIKILSALLLAQSGKVDDAAESLLGDNQYLRKHLEFADNVVYKMVFVQLIANNLDIVAYISSAHNVLRKDKISNLSKSEIDMSYPFAREFVMHHNSFKMLEQDPKFLKTEGKMPRWVVKLFFKPHMTINESVRKYTEVIELANLSSHEFAEKVVSRELKPSNGWSFRNYAGNILYKISNADYSKYIAMMHDLNSKISLTNYVLSGKKGPLANPYGSTYSKKTEVAGSICLDGPLEDSRNLRCIQTKIQ